MMVVEVTIRVVGVAKVVAVLVMVEEVKVMMKTGEVVGARADWVVAEEEVVGAREMVVVEELTKVEKEVRVRVRVEVEMVVEVMDTKVERLVEMGMRLAMEANVREEVMV